MSDATEYGLNVRRLEHKQTKSERKLDIQTYIVEGVEVDPEDAPAWVEWVGAGSANSKLHCHQCDETRPADPACKHIVATRQHLGFDS